MSETTNTPTVGSIYSRFFHLLGQDFGLILQLAVVSAVIPGVAFTFLSLRTAEAFVRAIFDVLPMGMHAASAAIAVVVAVPVGITLMAWNTSQLSYLVVARDSGLKPRFVPIFLSSLNTLFPVLALGLITGLAVGVGLCLGLLPGIFAGLTLCLAIPAYIGDADLSIFGALRRSIDLTRNHRWTIFLVSAAPWIVQMAVEGRYTPSHVPDDFIWPALLEDAKNELGYGFTALLTPVIYLCLRDAKAMDNPDNRPN